MPVPHVPPASNYRGALPFGLYLRLQEKFPQQQSETDAAWLKRIAAKSMVWDAAFREDLAGVLHRKRLDQAGLTRVDEIDADGSIKDRRDFRGKSYNVRDLTQTRQWQLEQARQYVTGPKARPEADQDRAAFDRLVQEFDGRTPHNGSIFWNGVSATKLAQCVSEWNKLPGVDVGQLEATTSFRWVNDRFVYQWGNAFANLTAAVSRKLGEAATGHVTAVVMCGLRDNSVLTQTELPEILRRMTADLKVRGRAPRVTDFSLVVLEPKHNAGLSVEILTNNLITRAKIIQPVDRRPINGRDDCVATGDFESAPGLKIPWQIQRYWSHRPLTASPAAEKIKTDFAKFYYGKRGLWAAHEILR
jgi:hypothetical protein